jgi:NDP-sugar pyrophosphorylase family protein
VISDAMIVAGGQGTRLRPLTDTTYKPLIEFCGRPFLEGVMDRLAAAGITRLWLVVGEDTEPFERALQGPAESLGMKLRCVPEPEPLDTAGGVHSVADEVDGAFLVLNGDVLTDVDFRAVIAAHTGGDADATIVLTRVDDTSTFGVCVRDGSRITAFVEKPESGTLPGQDTINAGTYVLTPSVFDPYGPGRLSFERQVFPDLLARGGHIEGFVWDGVWADLGTPDRYREGTRLALDGALDWPPVTDVPERAPGIRVHPTADVAADATLQAPVLVCEQSVVGPGAVVGPYSVIGIGAQVHAGARLHHAVLFKDAVFGADVRATGLLAGVGSHIEPGATLGDDVVIGDAVRLQRGASTPPGARVPDPAG